MSGNKDNFTLELKTGNQIVDEGMQGPDRDRREYKGKPFLVADAAKTSDPAAYTTLNSPVLSGKLYDGQCLQFWYSLKARNMEIWSIGWQHLVHRKMSCTYVLIIIPFPEFDGNRKNCSKNQT